VHVTLDDDPAFAVVTWISKSEKKNDPPCVFFSSSSRGGASACGNTTTIAHGGWQGLVHRVRFGPMTPGARVLFAVGQHSSGLSANFSLVLPPAASSSALTLAHVGDWSLPNGSQTLAALSGQAHTWHAVLASNFPFADALVRVWDDFGRETQPLFTSVPLLPVVGNHDVMWNFANFGTRYAPNDDALYYSRTLGGVHIVVMDTESGINSPHIALEQVTWLAADLGRAAANPAVHWRIVVGSRPLYCSCADSTSGECTQDTKTLRTAIEGVLVANDVDLVLASHRHAYERSLPVSFGAVNGTYASPRGQRAPVYIVNGLGGSLEGFYAGGWAPSSLRAFRLASPQLAFLRIAASTTSLTVTLEASVGSATLDSFALKR